MAEVEKDNVTFGLAVEELGCKISVAISTVTFKKIPRKKNEEDSYLLMANTTEEERRDTRDTIVYLQAVSRVNVHHTGGVAGYVNNGIP